MSIHVASEVAAQRGYAQELLDAFRQCCRFFFFFYPDSRNSALVLGNFNSCVQISRVSLFIWTISTPHLAALVV